MKPHPKPAADIPKWASLLVEAVNKPGMIMDAYSAFHNYGNCQGYARQRQIAINPVAQLPHKTLFHEAAHVLLGHTTESDFADTERTPKNLREVEAEAVALLCCEALSLEGADYCRGYIQNWLYPAVGFNGNGIPEKSAQKIFHAADQILRAGRLPANENANEKRQNQTGQASAFALA